jgi:peroxiredoxin
MRRSIVNREKIMQWIVFSIMAVLVISNLGCSAVAPEVGAQAPDFAASTLDGETVILDELRGQPVVLKFWATWCGYCRYQMPFFQAAFEEKGHEIEFVGINLRESRDKVQQFVEGESVGFTMALDVDGAVANSYNVRPIPATFFIDEHGVIKEIKIGAFMSQAELMAVLEDIY